MANYVRAMVRAMSAMLLISVGAMAVGEDNASHLEQLFESRPDFSSIPPIEYDTRPSEEIISPDQAHFVLQDIEVEGLPKDIALDKITAGYLGHEVDFNKLGALARSITKILRKQGYLLSQAILPPQKVRDGHVVFHVVHGSIHEIIPLGDKDIMNPRIEALLAEIKDQHPVSKDVLERNLMLISQLPGVDIKVVFKAPEGETAGTDMYITFHKDYGSFEGGISNDSTKYLGPWQGNVQGRLENLFGFNSRLIFLGAHSIDTHEMQFFSTGLQLPLMNDGLYFNIKAQISRTHPGDSLAAMRLRNTFKSISLGFTYPFILERHHRLDGGISLVFAENESFHRAVKLKREDTLRILHGFIIYDFADSWGGLNILTLSFSKGLRGLGAMGVSSTQKIRTDSKPDFLKTEFSLYRQQVLGAGFTLNFDGMGQLASGPLPSSERFSIGGAPYNRAYPIAVITADSGLMGRLSLNYTLSHDFGLTTGYGYVTQSVGWTRKPTLDEKRQTSLTGLGIGISHLFRNHIEGYVEYGIPLTKKVWGENINNKVYLGVRIKL